MPRTKAGNKEKARNNVVQKLEERLKEGDHYGALQMYKTLYSRHVNSDEVEQGIALAESSAISLIAYKQTTAASEMAMLLIEAYYKEPKLKVDATTKGQIRRIFSAFQENDSVGPELAEFLKAAVKWSAARGSRVRGDPELQALLAQTYRTILDFPTASKHFLHAEKPDELTEMTIEWASKGYQSEADLFLARVVLQLLCLENLRDANAVFEKFLAEGKDKGFSLDTPLVHYLRFLLLTLERDAAPLFQMLQKSYDAVLRRDSTFLNYVSIIGQKFYGFKPPQSGLSALMNMFGGGM